MISISTPLDLVPFRLNADSVLPTFRACPEALVKLLGLGRTPFKPIHLRALAAGGHVSLIGASLTPSGTGLDPLLLTGRGITLASISVGSRTDFEAMTVPAKMRFSCHSPLEEAGFELVVPLRD